MTYIKEWTHTTIPDFEPRPFQQKGYELFVDYARKEYASGRIPKAVFEEMTVGAGKSLLYAMIAKHFTDAGMKFMNLARTGELTKQNFDEAWALGCKASIYSASLGHKSTRYNAVYGTEGTVARALDTKFSEWVPDVLTIDECFTGETMIKTSRGLVRIDEVTTSDFVKCFDHENVKAIYDRPVKVFSSGVKNVVKVKTSRGEFRCTKNHRVFSIESKEYKEVEFLRDGEKIALDGSSDTVLIKLPRALAAVAKKLLQMYRRGL